MEGAAIFRAHAFDSAGDLGRCHHIASFARLVRTRSKIASSHGICASNTVFFDCAAAALGYAVAKAPSLRERRHLALGLYGLVTDQERFFVDAFERVSAPADQRTGLPPHSLSAPLHDLFLGVAKAEGYEEILACVLAAGWMYLT
jgi:hypothetical protein